MRMNAMTHLCRFFLTAIAAVAIHAPVVTVAQNNAPVEVEKFGRKVKLAYLLFLIVSMFGGNGISAPEPPAHLDLRFWLELDRCDREIQSMRSVHAHFTRAMQAGSPEAKEARQIGRTREELQRARDDVRAHLGELVERRERLVARAEVEQGDFASPRLDGLIDSEIALDAQVEEFRKRYRSTASPVAQVRSQQARLREKRHLLARSLRLEVHLAHVWKRIASIEEEHDDLASREDLMRLRLLQDQLAVVRREIRQEEPHAVEQDGGGKGE